MRHILALTVLGTGIVLFADDPAPPRGITTDAVVREVYDGDTIVVTVQTELRVRLLDCWAPEIRTRDAAEKRRGYASRDHLASLIPPGSTVRIQIPTTGRLEDSITLGRVLARAWRDSNGDGQPDADVSAEQVRAGHATIRKE
jgi:endonuclease YncB( thermonuclease family)